MASGALCVMTSLDKLMQMLPVMDSTTLMEHSAMPDLDFLVELVCQNLFQT